MLKLLIFSFSEDSEIRAILRSKPEDFDDDDDDAPVKMTVRPPTPPNASHGKHKSSKK